jgi:hypothetical protein
MVMAGNTMWNEMVNPNCMRARSNAKTDMMHPQVFWLSGHMTLLTPDKFPIKS